MFGLGTRWCRLQEREDWPGDSRLSVAVPTVYPAASRARIAARTDRSRASVMSTLGLCLFADGTCSRIHARRSRGLGSLATNVALEPRISWKIANFSRGGVASPARPTLRSCG